MYTYENQPIDELIDEICHHYPDLAEHMRRIENFYEKQVEDMLAEIEESQRACEGMEDEILSLEDELSAAHDTISQLEEELSD